MKWLVVLVLLAGCSSEESDYFKQPRIVRAEGCAFMIYAEHGNTAQVHFLNDASDGTCPLRRDDAPGGAL